MLNQVDKGVLSDKPVLRMPTRRHIQSRRPRRSAQPSAHWNRNRAASCNSTTHHPTPARGARVGYEGGRLGGLGYHGGSWNG